MRPKEITVSILNWNNNQATNRCLASIIACGLVDELSIILTDNNSTKEALIIDKKIKDSFGSSLVIEYNSQNRGFAGGHNNAIIAAKKLGHKYIVLLNNDTEILDSLLFSKLKDALIKSSDAIAAAPTILSSVDPNQIWYGGGKTHRIWSYTSHDFLNQSTEQLPENNKEVTFLTGCCMMLDLTKMPEDLLLWREDYFLYWEDALWCAMALRAGKKLLYVPKAQILHSVSGSLGQTSADYLYYNLRNNLLYIFDQSPVFAKPLGIIRVGYRCSVEIIKSVTVLRKIKGRIPAVLSALSAGLRRQSGARNA